MHKRGYYRRLPEDSNFEVCAYLFKIKEVEKITTGIDDIPRIIFLSMTKSLGKRAFSDSLPG